MGFKLIALGDKMPRWVGAGFHEYQKRLPRIYQIKLIEIPLRKNHRPHNLKTAIEKETKAMLAHIPNNAYCIALDASGAMHNTEALAKKIPIWFDHSHDIVLLIGGPEGLHQDCLFRANEKWSLSKLTFPHPLVRVIVAEQLYRASSIIQHHPYHK